MESPNQKQRFILVAKDYHSDVVSAVLWLRDYEIEIKCIRLRSYVDDDGDLFITPDIIIPLPEAKDYIERKEVKHKKEAQRSLSSAFSLKRGAFDEQELKQRVRVTLARGSDLTPRFVRLLEILLSEDRVFGREEVKQKLFENGVGADLGQAGRYLSNLSQFLTKKSNPHLRQMIEFSTGGQHGETKDDYHILPQYRPLLEQLAIEWNNSSDSGGQIQ